MQRLVSYSVEAAIRNIIWFTYDLRLLCIPRLTKLGFESMISKSWQYLSCPGEARPNNSALRGFKEINSLPQCHYRRALRWFTLLSLYWPILRTFLTMESCCIILSIINHAVLLNVDNFLHLCSKLRVIRTGPGTRQSKCQTARSTVAVNCRLLEGKSVEIGLFYVLFVCLCVCVFFLHYSQL